MMPDACHNAVIDGLEMLYALRLSFAPNEAQIDACVDAWLVALSPYCQAEADAGRILQAFSRLAGEISQWPAPKALIERLPARPEPKPLPKPKISAAERRQNLAMLDELMAAVGARSQVLKGSSEQEGKNAQ